MESFPFRGSEGWVIKAGIGWRNKGMAEGLL